MRGDLVGFLFQFLNRDKDRRAADRGRAAAKRADAVLDHAGVAVNHSHVVDVDAQFIRGDLRERSFLSLAVRRSAGQHRDFAGRLDTHCRAFPTTGGHRL